MYPTVSTDSTPPSPAEINEQIRQLAEGRTHWAADDLLELARLWAEWQTAATGVGE